MSDYLKSAATWMVDTLIGWTLNGGQDFGLIVAILVSLAVCLGGRYLMVPEMKWRSLASDGTRLRTLLRQAREEGDAEAVQRHKLNCQRVRLAKVRLEMAWLALCVVVLLSLSSWGERRLAYRTEKGRLLVNGCLETNGNQSIADVRLANTGKSALDSKQVRGPLSSNTADGMGKNQFTFLVNDAVEETVELCFEINGDSYTHQCSIGSLLADGQHSVQHSSVVQSHLDLAPYFPLGIVGGVDRIGMSPWMVAYLAVNLLCICILRFRSQPVLTRQDKCITIQDRDACLGPKASNA